MTNQICNPWTHLMLSAFLATIISVTNVTHFLHFVFHANIILCQYTDPTHLIQPMSSLPSAVPWGSGSLATNPSKCSGFPRGWWQPIWELLDTATEGEDNLGDGGPSTIDVALLCSQRDQSFLNQSQKSLHLFERSWARDSTSQRRC